MNVGILGLGLIGGSMARAYKKAGHTVYAFDTDKETLSFAKLSENADFTMSEKNIGVCELLLLATLPDAAVKYLENNAKYINKNTFVIDCCGTKKNVCKAGFALAGKYGFTFIGGHPMAGTHKSGFKNSRSDMFKGAPMVLVPPVFDNPSLISKAEELLAPAGFGSFSVTTAEKHDEMIAFTSQMPHIISNAFIKSPSALSHKGFSAGSYKDLTRVAWLNAPMWTRLFIENAGNVTKELDFLIKELTAYKKAISTGDSGKLCGLLEEGKRRKEEVDGK